MTSTETAGRLGTNGRRSARTLADLDAHPLPIYSRAEVLRRLGATLQARSPIVAAGSSCGLVAKSAEAGGADLIVVYSTGISRLQGLPTTIFGEPNDMSLAMAGEILNVVESTPVICGVEAADPQHTRLSGLLEKVVAAGYSGIINFPTVTLLEPGTRQREAREGLGFGFARAARARPQGTRSRGVHDVVRVPARGGGCDDRGWCRLHRGPRGRDHRWHGRVPRELHR